MDVLARIESPFDQIKRVDEYGEEYWSARDLMPMLGYAQWRQMDETVQRAMIACENSGADLTSNFAGARKDPLPNTPGSAAKDWHLSRYGAYLTAMNGDPRKPEIAAAQTYFTIMTREAETRPTEFSIPDPSTPEGALAIGQMFVAKAQELVLARQQIAVLEPKAEVADALFAADGEHNVMTVAKMFGRPPKKFYAMLVLEEVMYQKASGRHVPYQGWVENGVFKVRVGYHSDQGRQVAHELPTITSQGLCRLYAHLSRRGHKLNRPPNMSGQLELLPRPDVG